MLSNIIPNIDKLYESIFYYKGIVCQLKHFVSSSPNNLRSALKLDNTLPRRVHKFGTRGSK